MSLIKTEEEEKSQSISNPKIKKEIQQNSHIISFTLFKHNRQNPSLKHIISIKQLFSKCLTRMPKTYIMNTILDENHLNLLMIKDKTQLIGAVTFKLFIKNNFNQIIFFAIKPQNQGKGYGTKLMSVLKIYMQKLGIRNLLTYADDLAHKFFYRQGFRQNINLSPSVFAGLIKKYEGGTLMHCFIQEKIKEQKNQKTEKTEKIIKQEKINSKTIEQNQQKSKIIEQNSTNSKITEQIQLKPQKKEINKKVIKITKKDKKQNKEQIQDQNSLMKWLKKPENISIMKQSEK